MDEIKNVSITGNNTRSRNYLLNELKVSINDEIITEIQNLRSSIKTRIEEIDIFYENNISDYRVLNFEKVRIKLKKILTYDPYGTGKLFVQSDSLRSNKIETNNSILNQQTPLNPQISKKTLRVSLEEGLIILPHLNQLSPIGEENTRYSNITNSMSQIKTYLKKSRLKKENELTSKQSSSKELAVTGKKSSVQIDENINNITKSVLNKTLDKDRENEKLKELTFFIKLSEPEYKLLLKEKSRLFINIK